MNSESPPPLLTLSGTQMALLNGALVAFPVCPFRQPEGIAARRDIDRRSLDDLEESLRETWQSHLGRAGLATLQEPPSLTYSKRAELSVSFHLSHAQTKAATLVLRACAAEFCDDEAWEEFTLVAPGGLWLYPATPSTLKALADVFESLPRDAGIIKHPSGTKNNE